ncbi:MAG: tRNA (N(6)-L-threonylcarbamoyladenosine(37)-C(2))-methylthiotransferase MtaB [Nitrospirota bacterium]
MKVSVLTLGCRVNQSESAIIEGNLSKRGWSLVGLSDYPDYCIVNTCTVTGKSDYQSRQLIRRALRKGARVIVTGCYAQRSPEDIKKINDNIVIIRNNDKLNIISMLSNIDERITFIPIRRSRPYLKIQDGCNLSCTFCAVPLARGRSRSVEIPEVIRQAHIIEAGDHKEVVLTGIHLGSYGHDLEPKVKLSNLLKILLKRTKISRIRLSSLEVKEVDSELIELFQEERICKHIHLPLQSGDDTILKQMGRTYTTHFYTSIINNIIRRVPNISIGTDIIVGFPGEGRREFLNTKALLDFLPITYMHIFPFSPRPNTPASKMGMQISSIIKKERLSELKSLNDRKKKKYMLSQIDRTLDIIIEEKCGESTSIGTSSNYLRVRVPSKGHHKKDLIKVSVTGIQGGLLTGDAIESL